MSTQTIADKQEKFSAQKFISSVLPLKARIIKRNGQHFCKFNVVSETENHSIDAQCKTQNSSKSFLKIPK